MVSGRKVLPRRVRSRWYRQWYLLWRRLKRAGALGLIAVLLSAAGWHLYEVRHARVPLVWQGVPEAIGWHPLTWTRILRNDGFLVGWSDVRGNPLWVKYRLQAITGQPPRLPRPRDFSRDWRAINAIGQDAYRGSGYDRGHLAPNYAISRMYGRTAQLQAFRMTNITPQRPNLNRRVWQRLEEVEANFFTRHAATLWVVTGPVFDADIERLPTQPRVEIPDAFYKVYAALDGDGGPLRMLAFVVPQEVQGNEPLDRFVTTVRHVEQLTGLNFFPALEPGLQEDLETTLDTRPWRLQEVARRPSRY